MVNDLENKEKPLQEDVGAAGKETHPRSSGRPFASYLAAVFCFGLGMLVGLRALQTNEALEPPAFKAIALKPAIPWTGFPDDFVLTKEDIPGLLQTLPLEPRSSRDGVVPEATSGNFTSLPSDIHLLGFNQSSFLVDTRWSTIRYVGRHPAGGGLTGEALNRAQTEALGKRNDTIPVITAAVTIDNMMNSYFEPILSSLPVGARILPRIKVQGAYFSPGHSLTNAYPAPHRDNAFVVGLQSLYIYPSSCFERPNQSHCQADAHYSAGHDPTILAHELGHVIYNHLRAERNMEGFQWTAVNEGYADYFAASYFAQPVLGKIFKLSRIESPYLRRLLDNPTTSNPEYLKDAHRFSVVWSSTLWRLRNTLHHELGVPLFQIDRVLLNSILYLGETSKIRLGDAATAVMKSAEVLGYSTWKDIMRKEFDAAEIPWSSKEAIGTPLVNTETTLSAADSQMKPGGCGNIAVIEERKISFSHLFILIFPLLMVFRRTLWKSASLFSLLIFAVFLGGCKTPELQYGKQLNNNTAPPGPTVSYLCYPDRLDSAEAPGAVELHLTWLSSSQDEAEADHVLVSNGNYGVPSNLLLLLDKKTSRVDQVRHASGRVYEHDVKGRLVSDSEAAALRNMRLASFILEDGARPARIRPSQGKAAEEQRITSFESRAYFSDVEKRFKAPSGYGPLPHTLYRFTDPPEAVCSFHGMLFP